jgi:two-component system, chemotaxis family, CheB/CheR fusion protein
LRVPLRYVVAVGRFRIAYVEDSSHDAELLMRALLQMLPEAELVHFRDAESAQAFFSESASRSAPLDLAIIDIHLPAMRGDTLITWLRQHPAYSRLPIIALSGFTRLEPHEVEAIGATSFLTKPVTYNDYIDLVYEIRAHCDVEPSTPS